MRGRMKGPCLDPCANGDHALQRRPQEGGFSQGKQDRIVCEDPSIDQGDAVDNVSRVYGGSCRGRSKDVGQSHGGRAFKARPTCHRRRERAVSNQKRVGDHCAGIGGHQEKTRRLGEIGQGRLPKHLSKMSLEVLRIQDVSPEEARDEGCGCRSCPCESRDHRDKVSLHLINRLSCYDTPRNEGSNGRAYNQIKALSNGPPAGNLNVSKHLQRKQSSGTASVKNENSHSLHYTYLRNEQSMSSAVIRAAAACRLPTTLASLCETGCIFRDPSIRHLACKGVARTDCAAPCAKQPCPCIPCPKMEVPVKGKIVTHLS